MRIALLTYSTRPRGGVVHTLALAEALAAGGDDVTVFTLGRGGDGAFFRPVDPAVTIEVVALADVDGETVGGRVLRSIDALAAALAGRADEFDVVHAQDCISANAAGPCIRTVHHLDAFTTPELAACHERAIVTPIAHVCVSRSVADELVAGWGIAATVIPNGVDAARFEAAASDAPAARAARAAWRDELPPGPIVLSVGGIEPRKGTIDLVDAMVRVRRDVPDVQLVIAGGETLFDHRDYRAAFDARCAATGVAPVVLGPVADDRLPALVAVADAFAFPSCKEGFGLAAMEALAAGIPVVMRDLPVLREVFDGAATFASDPDATGVALVGALAGSGPGPGAGIALARRHRWDDAADAHRRFYRAVLPTL